MVFSTRGAEAMVKTGSEAILTTSEVLSSLLSRMSRDEVARLLKVHPSYVSHLVAGRRRLGFGNAQVLADVIGGELRVSPDGWTFAVLNGSPVTCVSRKSDESNGGEK